MATLLIELNVSGKCFITMKATLLAQELNSRFGEIARANCAEMYAALQSAGAAVLHLLSLTAFGTQAFSTVAIIPSSLIVTAVFSTLSSTIYAPAASFSPTWTAIV